MQSLRAGALFLACLAAGCASSADRNEPVTSLTLGEEAYKRNEPERALALATAWPDENFARPELERKMILEAKAQLALGNAWKAYVRLREFPDLHRFSPLLHEAERTVFAAGTTLIRSDGGFLFFSNDADDGQVVLEHFVVHYSRSRDLCPDALRLLAEKAFREERWDLARERMSHLLRDFPDSEWATLARFKIAMARYLALEGPAYDLDALTLAHNELKDFLAGSPENPKFREEAAAALAHTRSWLGEKHLQIAAFYDRLGNRYGSTHHLELARDEFAETEAAARAIERIGPRAPKTGTTKSSPR